MMGSSSSSSSSYRQAGSGVMAGGGPAAMAALAAMGMTPPPLALQSRQISNLWMNSVPNYSRAAAEVQEDEEVAAEDEDDMGVIETYSNYMPTKLKVFEIIGDGGLNISIEKF